MKNNILAVLAIAFLIVGCTTAKVTPANPATGQPATTNYIVDPRIASTVGTATAVADAVPVWGGLARPVIEAAGGLVTALSLLVAKRKNEQANASTLLAKTVVQGIEQADVQGVKDTISAHAGKIGVEGELNTFVQRVNNGSI